MTFVYPEDKFPPDSSMRFSYSSEVQSLRDEFINQGKILATDSYFSKSSFSQTNTVVFKSENEFDEWKSNPMVAEFFLQRDDFLAERGIIKSSEYIAI